MSDFGIKLSKDSVKKFNESNIKDMFVGVYNYLADRMGEILEDGEK